MFELSRDELITRLKEMDTEVQLSFKGSERYQVIIVGSSALILLGLIEKKTMDIDTIHVSEKLYPFLEKYDINTRAETYINCIPMNFEDRITHFHKGRLIDFYVLSLEDIVVAKLCAARQEDKEDIISKDVLKNIDWELLEYLATDDDELKAASLNERNYKDFLYDYSEYVRRYKP
jgi:hypothetical protein